MYTYDSFAVSLDLSGGEPGEQIKKALHAMALSSSLTRLAASIDMDATANTHDLDKRIADAISAALRKIKHGSITLVVHGGEVTEIAATEKTRLAPQK